MNEMVDEHRIRSYTRALNKAEAEGKAIQNAMQSHPVVKYVLSLPVESALYPANRYLKFSEEGENRIITSAGYDFRKASHDSVNNLISSLCSIGACSLDESIHPHDDCNYIHKKSNISQKNPVPEIPIQKIGAQETRTQETRIQETRMQKIRINDRSIKQNPITQMKFNHNGSVNPLNMNYSTNRSSENEIPVGSLITWCLPGHDIQRPKEKRCGVIRTNSNEVVFTSCPDDHSHHLKAKSRHCWSLRCPRCMNDTALKHGIQVERRLLMYATLMKKQGDRPGSVSHFTISPPQEFMKSAMQTYESFDDLNKYIESKLMEYGASCGYTVFHPWRQTTFWKHSPHFHVLLYGFIDTKGFIQEHPGWIIKKIHAKESIRSVRHTVSYLLTHMGLGQVEVDPDSVDWDLRVLDMMIPGILSSNADYTDKDRELQVHGKGCMVGDISEFDWLQWTKDRLHRDIRTRYWGGVSRRNIVNIDSYRQYKLRTCKECGSVLRVYQGFSDTEGDYVRYVQDSPIMCFASNASLVRNFFQKYKSSLPAVKSEHTSAESIHDHQRHEYQNHELQNTDRNFSHNTQKQRNRESSIKPSNIIEITRLIPFAASTLELPIQMNNDIILDGPFDEPDEFFLKRQRKAYGTDIDTV